MPKTIIHENYHDAEMCEDYACRDHYCRHILDEILDHSPPLPMPAARLLAPRCDCCGQRPTNDNPVTQWPGQPADLENGPHLNDLPYAICERCAAEY